MKNILIIGCGLLGSSLLRKIHLANQSMHNKKWEKKNEDRSYLDMNENLDVVFILTDSFEGEIALKGEKYAIVIPVNVGLSSEDYYSVKTGLKENELIVTGRFRVLSKELQHGMKVLYEDESSSD